MIRITILLLLALHLVGASGFSTRIGLLTPTTSNNDSLLALRGMLIMQEELTALGSYAIYTEPRMAQTLALVGDELNTFCHEPRCVSLIGESMNMHRMIYGDIVVDSARYAVHFTLVDVAEKEVLGEVTIEGKAEITLEQVIKEAIRQLHDLPLLDSTSFTNYTGAPADNRKEFAIASGSYMAAAGLIGGLTYDATGNSASFDEDLSGLDPTLRNAPKSARAKGLGNSYVALSTDAYGAFFNPAGLAWLSGPAATMNFQSRNSIMQTWSASYVNKLTKNMGWGNTFLYGGGSISNLQELEFGTQWAYKFDTFEKFPPFSVGVNLILASLQTHGGSGSEYDIEGTGFGASLDIGGFVHISKIIEFGFTFYNVPAFMWYSNATQEYSYQENRVPAVKLGGSFQVHYTTLLVAEGQIPLAEDQYWRFSGGVEQQLWSYIRVRLGTEKIAFAPYETPWSITAGLGIRVPMKERNLYLDGAYQLNTDFELRNTWDVSIMIDL